MRNYFLIREDEQFGNKIRPIPVEVRGQSFHNIPNVSYVQVDSTGNAQHLDWMDRPRVIISDAMKLLLDKYNSNLQFKIIHAIDQVNSMQTTYWFVEIPAVECTSAQCQLNNNGTIKELSLDYSQIQKHHIFTIEDISEPYVVISLELAESMLRRSMRGFLLTRVALA